MKSIASILRALQLYAHNAHNLASGPTLFQDHDFFGGLYEAYEGEYDSVVERLIGEEGDAPLGEITKDACEMAGRKEAAPSEVALKTILATEKLLCAEIKKVVPKSSDGTQNLLQGICDTSLVRQYKIQQRLKK